MALINVSDADFQATVIESTKPVLLDFWAPWCGPCKQIAPALESLAKKYDDKIVIAKMNVDENPHTPSKFGVRGIPMLLILKNGTVASTKVGSLPESQIDAWIAENI